MTAGNADSPSPSPRDLLADLYAQLHAAAGQQMQSERRDHTLSATALVHEAWLRLSGPRHVPLRERAHFYVAFVQAMQRVLLDHAKARGRQKRGGGRARVDLDTPIDLARTERLDDYLDLEAAIERLRAHDPRLAEIVRLRSYCGLGVAETAAVLGVSDRTVKADWAFARAWLARELDRESDADPRT
jgi:RNA polymerase sigma factor (TIGR02999 family)